MEGPEVRESITAGETHGTDTWSSPSFGGGIQYGEKGGLTLMLQLQRQRAPEWCWKCTVLVWPAVPGTAS